MWPSNLSRWPLRVQPPRAIATLRDLAALRLVRAAEIRSAVETAAALRGWAEFRREIDRSRRHERPLALGALVVDRTNADPFEVAAVVTPRVRSVDVVWADGANVFVAMPETDTAGAVLTMKRLAGPTTSRSVNGWRLAVYPEDAWTADALVDALQAPDDHGRMAAEGVTTSEPVRPLP